MGRSEPKNLGGPNKRAGERGHNVRGCMNTLFDAPRKTRFIELLAESGVRADAARVVGVSCETVRRHKTPDDSVYDPEFTEMYEEAMERYRATLISEAHRRGVDGVDEPVFYKGGRAYEQDGDLMEPDPDNEGQERKKLKPAAVRKYSDSLLAMMLKRHCPEFREKSTVENINHEGKAAMALADLSHLSREKRDLMRKLLEEDSPPDGSP